MRDNKENPPRSEAEIFGDLEKLCASPGYAHVLAYFCFRDNIIGFSDELKSDDYAKMYSTERLIRSEISVLVGLMAKKPLDLSFPSPDLFQQMIDKTDELLKEMHLAMSVPFMGIFFKAIEERKTNSDVNPFNTAEALREPMFYAAESAYTFQYRDLSVQKYAKDEEWLKKAKGFSMAEVKKVSLAINDYMNNNMMNVMRSLSGKRPDEWTLLPAFEFSTSDIIEKSGLEEQTVKRILEAFAYPNTGNPTFTALHEFNETNATPLIKIGSDRYILFQYYSWVEATYDTPFYWMGADKSYFPTAAENRGHFTEQFTATRLKSVFGDARVYCNVDIWDSPNKKKKKGEIDILVIVGNRALVIQNKSKKLTLAARKGNDPVLKADFKAAVQDACDQAILCCDELISGAPVLTDADGKEVTIPTELKQVFPVCVISDHYPALSFQARQFIKAKTTDIIQPALVCDVFFIDVVTEMLTTPLRLLSYLELRAKANDNVMSSVELVALGYHLKRNLWLEKNTMLMLEDDISVGLDVAMAARRDGIPGVKTPPGILTRLKGTTIGKVIDQLENRTDSGAIELGLQLLQMSEEALLDLNMGIEKISKDVLNDGKPHDITLNFGSASSGMTLHCNNLPDVIAVPSLQTHCVRRKYKQKASSWYGLAIEPGTHNVRFGINMQFPWVQNDEMDKSTSEMIDGMPPAKFRGVLKGQKINSKRQTGRNAACTCGSGKKYKRCCLSKYE